MDSLGLWFGIINFAVCRKKLGRRCALFLEESWSVYFYIGVLCRKVGLCIFTLVYCE